VAAAGAVGGSLLTEALTAPARAASGRLMAMQATTTETGAVAPAVVGLTDAAQISVDASLGNDFRVTIGGNRTMGNPANPTDGQKITFQITQGGSGTAAVTWSSSFEFSAGLPQPTLSTAAGDTDLLCFIYNAARVKWLLASFVKGFSTTVTPPPAGAFRLFPTTNGPSTPVSYSGPFLAGVLFEVTQGGCWFEGYWWWVCPSGQSTAAQTFALWAAYNDGTGALVPGTTVTSGPLTAGQWNYVALSAPVPLAVGACYNAATGFSGSFPITNGQYGSGEPFAAGIVNGPLTAFSDQSGSAPAPFAMSQGVFSTSGADPTVSMPAGGSGSSNFWMDLQVSTTAPAGATYRLWPSYPTLPGVASADTGPYMLGTEFLLAKTCTLNKIWYYSGSGATMLPSRIGIFNVSTKAEVSGTDNSSPSWSGPAGSGWVSCAYSGVTLPAGDYKVAAFSPGGSKWYQVTTSYWGTGGPGANGITTGPLTAPGVASASSPGQSTYQSGSSWTYPATYGTTGNGENFWVDIEVTPS
jgi:hypothetical protein